MPVFSLPVVLMIEADSIEDAQKALEDWSEEIDLEDDLPIGTEDIDIAPHCEHNDEGQRLLYLPGVDEDSEPTDDSDEESDDFNDSEEDF